MSTLREYVVTAASYEVLDDLCNDIESPSGSLYIPGRAIDVANLRPVSRSTHYYLTDQEADQIRNDPRVLSVELLPEDLGITPSPLYIQGETTWDRSSLNVNTHKNWGLLRVFEGQNRPTWGSTAVTSQTGVIDVPLSGKNVDVIIVDGLFNPEHPEFAVNSDGSGGSRVNQYNWYQLNPQVNGSPVGTYVYTPYTGGGTDLDANNNHGAHVAGTVAGNTQGWARSATIYNIYPYGTNPNPLEIFDYIRVFHRSKPINPNTGVRNPTIVNNSWGYSFKPNYTTITSVVFRGITYNGPFTKTQLNNYGIYVDSNDLAYLSVRYNALDVDVQDAIKDGIIVVGAAGNNYQKIDIVGGQDYNNRAVYNGLSYFYNRGISPGAASNGICVGAASATTFEPKTVFSNCGPRVDVYAPGQNIMSSFNNTVSYGGTTDPRVSSHYIGKISGTSMASPQVCGILACVLEMYPNMTQLQAVQYIQSYAKFGQMFETTNGPSDYTDLQGSVNRYLSYVKERPTEGEIYPKKNYKARPESGIVYPRTRVIRYGS